MEQIRLDIVPKGIMPVCHASQYDKGRVIRCNLVDGLQGYVLTDETITLNVRKPDDNIVTAAVEVVSGTSYVDIVTTEQMTACEGNNICELTITKDDVVISTLNFKMQVEVDPLKDGIESETEIHNLTQQVIDIVSDQYDSSNVIFDDEPTEGHVAPYTVSSGALKSYIPKEITGLDDVSISSPISNQALVWDAENNKWTNGEVSTVGNLDDLNDVDTTGKASGDSLRYDGNEWIAKPTTIEMTQAEYDALQTKEPNTHYVITDAPNLNPTASDIEYQSGVTVKQAIDSKQDSLTFGGQAVTWNDTNVTGGADIKWYYKYGRVVIAHLEFTPKSGRIANGNVICSGLPKPHTNYNCFGGNQQQMVINANGELIWYFPTDTTTLNRIDLNIAYFSAT